MLPMIAGLVMGFASANPLYSTTEFTAQVPNARDIEWPAKVRAAYKRKKIELYWQDPVSAQQTRLYPPGDGVDLKSLERPAWVGAWLALYGDFDVGSEYDLVLATDDGVLPVTVWLDERKRVTISMGKRIDLPAAGPEIGLLAEKYDVAGITNEEAQFEPRLRGVLDLSLGMLSETERAQLTEITFIRKGGASNRTHGKWISNAEYLGQDTGSTIRFFDDVLRASSSFVGTVQAPYHPAFHAVVHEIGHAIDDRPRLRNYENATTAVHAFNAAVEDRNADVVVFNAGGGRNAALAASLKTKAERLTVLDKTVTEINASIESYSSVSTGFRLRFGPVTTYGKTSDTEAFAEAFALFHLDPAALKRVSPDAFAWFEAGHHIGE